MGDDFPERRRRFIETNTTVQEAADPDARALIELMKSQLLIVLVDRLGGDLVIPVGEIDGTGDRLLSMSVEGRSFRFTVTRKN